MTRRDWLIGVIGLSAMALGVGLGTRHFDLDRRPEPAVAQFLQQTLPDASGNMHALARFKNQPLLINFWATWCAPCVEEMPALSALQGQIKAKNIQILGIGIDSADEIAQFAKRYQIQFPLYVSGMTGTDLSRSFGNSSGGLPFSVLISAQGKVVKTYLGRLDFVKLRADLKQL